MERDGERATPELCGLAVSRCHSAKLLYSSQPGADIDFWPSAFHTRTTVFLFCFPAFFGPKKYIRGLQDGRCLDCRSVLATLFETAAKLQQTRCDSTHLFFIFCLLSQGLDSVRCFHHESYTICKASYSLFF